jgi:hypothetical protein
MDGSLLPLSLIYFSSLWCLTYGSVVPWGLVQEVANLLQKIRMINTVKPAIRGASGCISSEWPTTSPFSKAHLNRPKWMFFKNRNRNTGLTRYGDCSPLMADRSHPQIKFPIINPGTMPQLDCKALEFSSRRAKLRRFSGCG